MNKIKAYKILLHDMNKSGDGYGRQVRFPLPIGKKYADGFKTVMMRQ